MPVGFAVEKPGERRVVDAVAVAFDIADERAVGISPSADGVEVAGWPREHRRCGVGGLIPGKDILVDRGPPGCEQHGQTRYLAAVRKVRKLALGRHTQQHGANRREIIGCRWAGAFDGIGVGTGVTGCATDGDGPILLMVGDEDCATLGCITAAGTALMPMVRASPTVTALSGHLNLCRSRRMYASRWGRSITQQRYSGRISLHPHACL